jgi:outer membrane protein assembly factor BamB
MARSRLGWLGPILVGIGVAIGAWGVWYMVHARPAAGNEIDRIAIDDRHALVVRAEAGGDRAFVELRSDETVVWQALVPHYGGRPGAPGIAWCPTAVSVRVIRDGHAELFALAMHDASKLGGMRLAPDHGPIAAQADGPVTLTDHVRSYEIVAGPDWHQLVAIDLATGQALWARELGSAPVRAGGVTGAQVWIDQGAGPHVYAALTGKDSDTPRPGPDGTHNHL